MIALYHHPLKKCGTCEFWVYGDQEARDEKLHPDDRKGQCHRYAPRASQGEYEYTVLHFLWVISGHAEIDWEEVQLDTSTWPATDATDWCGEWNERIHEPVRTGYGDAE